jgi:hypothetical protein
MLCFDCYLLSVQTHRDVFRQVKEVLLQNQTTILG